ncbi:MAG: TIGR04211 family SH3 domain-containing protein [Chromatiales bacterium]|nr:TIGR04211 family SH3 domain-containing protein [Chromatiales bacterium]
MKKIALLMVLLAVFSFAQAETRYVTDQFKITLRSGESATHKILRMLPSGEGLQLLSTNKESGYSRVRAQDGKVGFVLTRQLMDIPSARDRLAKAEKRLDELLEEPGRLTAKLATLQENHQRLTTEHKNLQQEKQTLEQELQSINRTAANAIRISNERNELRKQLAALTRQAEDLKQENRELKNDSAQKWFLIGAGVIIGGIILGLILPHLRFQRRKSSWGSL